MDNTNSAVFEWLEVHIVTDKEERKVKRNEDSRI
jgi:hypothetical protein